MNILITGGNGQLGSELRRISENHVGGDNYLCTDIIENDNVTKLDITNISDIRNYVVANNIDVIVNCAAYTNVDKAEDDVTLATLINADAVANLATVCKERGAFLIHISTDYVFGGDSSNLPYTEDVKANPLGVYGVTKLKGEENIKEILDNYLIIRTAWLYSEFGNNFVKTMRKLMVEREQLKVVFDQVGTPTYAADLAATIYKIINERLFNNSNYGIYHFSNEGVCSWYDFAVAIQELSKLSGCKILPCYSSDFPSKVKRPAFSVLDKTKIKQNFEMSVPYWRNSLERCIERL